IDPDHNIPQIFYEDEDHDKVLLASDSDLQAAIDHAKSIGWKSLRLHLDDIDPDHNIPQIFYEDEDHDKVLLASDSDLQAAIDHAKSIGWKSLRLH
ncbi:hypothetical protein VFJ35_02550, partial [Enterococcus faecalis]|uniref:hypothetical protein n=1 Tax=Enterococcus faecalis TaxID=1351 RepID=UPI002D024314